MRADLELWIHRLFLKESALLAYGPRDFETDKKKRERERESEGGAKEQISMANLTTNSRKQHHHENSPKQLINTGGEGVLHLTSRTHLACSPSRTQCEMH